MSRMDLYIHISDTLHVSKIITCGSIYSHYLQNTRGLYTGLFHVGGPIMTSESTSVTIAIFQDLESKTVVH